MGRRGGRVLTQISSSSSTGAAALSETSAVAVRSAAADRQALVVEHGIPARDFLDDDQIEALLKERPQGWFQTVEADVDPLRLQAVRRVEPSLPQTAATPVVARLFHLQRSSTLKTLTDSVYDPLEAVWSSDEPWLERDASLLAASAGAVTPAHSDRHHNLLVELTGTKLISYVLPGTAAHAEALVRSWPDLRVDAMPEGVQTLELVAGQAVYLPPYTIHWVRSTERAVALTCGWRTPDTDRAGELYAAQASLRHLRIAPRSLGGRGDTALLHAARAARKLRAVIPSR